MNNTNRDIKVSKVVNGPVKTKKKSKFAGAIISEDASKVTDYIFMDVLLPALKKAVSDVIKNGIDMILYGEVDRGRTKSNVGRVSYGKYYETNRDNRDYRSNSYTTRNNYSYDDIILENRGEAEAVLSQMDEIIAAYGFVRVADLYEMVGITGSHTDNNYGWTDIRSAQAVRVRDGYLLKLPRAMAID